MGLYKTWTEGTGQLGLYYVYTEERNLFMEACQAYNFCSYFPGQFQEYGFRAFNNDGSESASTPLAVENENITITPNQTLRLRVGINTKSDARPANFTLMCRSRYSDGTMGPWQKVENTNGT